MFRLDSWLLGLASVKSTYLRVYFLPENFHSNSDKNNGDNLGSVPSIVHFMSYIYCQDAFHCRLQRKDIKGKEGIVVPTIMFTLFKLVAVRVELLAPLEVLKIFSVFAKLLSVMQMTNTANCIK